MEERWRQSKSWKKPAMQLVCFASVYSDSANYRSPSSLANGFGATSRRLLSLSEKHNSLYLVKLTTHLDGKTKYEKNKMFQD